MTRKLTILASFLIVALALTGCRRDAQPDPLPEAEAEVQHEEPVADEGPGVPTCGDWVVIVEAPTVTGNFDADSIQRSFLEGLRAGGCEAHTSRPTQLPPGTPLLNLATRVQAVGTGGNLSVVATDVSSGDVHSRHQDRITSQAATVEARQLGENIAARLLR